MCLCRDHIYTDAALAKMNFRWRTALIVRELEEEVRALSSGRAFREELKVPPPVPQPGSLLRSCCH